MAETSKNYNVQFGLIYTIAIISVVCMHAGAGVVGLAKQWFPWETWQLGIFAFASGYFFINNKKRKTGEIVKKKFLKFIIPLIAWNIFYGIILTIFHKTGLVTFGEDINFENAFLKPFYFNHQFFFNCPAWFLVPLFFLEIINIPVLKRLNKNKHYFVYFIASIVISLVGAKFATMGYKSGWLRLLQWILLFLPFFSFGMLYRVYLEKKDVIPNFWYFAFLIFAASAIMFVAGRPVSYVAVWLNFSHFYLPFVTGMLGILFWLRVTRILAPAFKDSKFVKVISSNTFSIMMHHLFGVFLINLLFLVIHNMTGKIDFDYSKFSTSIYYTVALRGVGQLRIIYIVFGILYGLFVGFFMKKIKKTIIINNKKGKKWNRMLQS